MFTKPAAGREVGEVTSRHILAFSLSFVVGRPECDSYGGLLRRMMDRRWAYKEYMPAGSMLLFRRYISRLRLVRPRIFMGRRLAGFAARAPRVGSH